MSSIDSKLYQFAVQEAQEAVALDAKGHYKQAIVKYQRAAEGLLQFIKFNKNQIMNQKCKIQIKEYLERAKILNAHTGGSRSRKKIIKKDIGEPPENKIEEQGENVSAEEQELLDMIAGTIITESPNVRWTDIAGLKSSKQLLREAIVLPILKPELFTGVVKPWSGILLFGPPGCGKTLLGRAAASECNATFFSTSSSDLLSKWLGESEKLISALFKLARIKAPSLIFMDEIDSIATSRGSGSESGGERRVKTQLLSEIQGIKSDNDKPLLVVGATNRPWDLDNAMLSRFQKRVHVPLPDIEARKAIFKIHTKGVNMILDDDDFIELAVRSEGYSGRDISNICQEVVMLPIRELDISGILEDPNKEVKRRDLTIDDFKKTLKKIKPMASKKDLKHFQEWSEDFGEY
ncbi:MAG: AAA family ATPase [Candidatus Lokiarchaeota archaeon]|nr:AAA family ATPase [Candidatus Lokiarchaeota archaeon]